MEYWALDIDVSGSATKKLKKLKKFKVLGGGKCNSGKRADSGEIAVDALAKLACKALAPNIGLCKKKRGVRKL